MALLQAILTLISRSAGRILNALFGWAVRALFGQPSPREETLLSVVVGLAAAWPILVLGIIAPKVVAFALTFVPYVHRAPSWVVRIVWSGLAVLAPLIVGYVFARKTPALQHESFLRRVLRGYPLTVGLAAAFVFMFITVPFLRLLALARGRRTEQIPLVARADVYHAVAAQVAQTLTDHGVRLAAAPAPWWMSVPSRILVALGGDAFRNYMPEKLEFFRGPELEVALYPNGVQLRGTKKMTGWSHGLVAEALTRSDAFQTTDLQAQAIELKIHEAWKIFDGGDPDRARRELETIAATLAHTEIDYSEWQILYRETLQVARAIDGLPQLFDVIHREHPIPTMQHVDESVDQTWRVLAGNPDAA